MCVVCQYECIHTCLCGCMGEGMRVKNAVNMSSTEVYEISSVVCADRTSCVCVCVWFSG